MNAIKINAELKQAFLHIFGSNTVYSLNLFIDIISYHIHYLFVLNQPHPSLHNHRCKASTSWHWLDFEPSYSWHIDISPSGSSGPSGSCGSSMAVLSSCLKKVMIATKVEKYILILSRILTFFIKIIYNPWFQEIKGNFLTINALTAQKSVSGNLSYR